MEHNEIVSTKKNYDVFSRHPFSKTYLDLAEVMENETLQRFVDNYLTDWDKAQIAVLLMKTYNKVREGCIETTGKVPSKEQMALFLTEIMADTEYRKQLVQEWNQFLHNKKSALT